MGRKKREHVTFDRTNTIRHKINKKNYYRDQRRDPQRTDTTRSDSPVKGESS